MTIGPKWLLHLDILRRLRILIGVPRTFLLVILELLRNFVEIVVFYIWSICGHWDYCLPVILFSLGIRWMLCPCFDHMWLFQALLQPCFVCLMKHFDAILAREKVYSSDSQLQMFVGAKHFFFRARGIVTMTIAHCGPDVPAVRSCALMRSQMLSALSVEPTIICCAGASANFIKALVKAPSQKAGIQYPFNLLPLQIEKLMHKPSFSVMGKSTCSRRFGRCW